MTLTEVLVAMVLTAIVFAIMIPALLPYLQLLNDTKIRSTSTSDAEIVFERIDSEVRFAYAINQQGYGSAVNGVVGGATVPLAQRAALAARYVEWLTPATSSPTGKNLCTQWRFVPATNSIEERQWNLDSVPPPTFTQRLQLAIDEAPVDWVSSTVPAQNEDDFGRPTYPFAMTSASQSNATPLQSLTVWVYAGQSEAQATTQLKTLFVARNSASDVVTNALDGNAWGDTSTYGYGRDVNGTFGLGVTATSGYLLPSALKAKGGAVSTPTVSLVCNASVSSAGVVTPFPSSNPFRP